MSVRANMIMIRVSLSVVLLTTGFNTQAQSETVVLQLIPTESQTDPATMLAMQQPYAVIEQAEIDYAAVTQQMRSGCSPEQTRESAAFTTTVVDLPPLTVIAGKASWLPPFPLSPDATIEGVDADGDCVRDDIEHYVAKKFPSRDDYRLRKYLYEYTAWMRRFMWENLSINTARTSFNNMAALSNCVREIIDDRVQADETLQDLFGQFHNTYPRSHRYADNLPRIAGWTNREKISVSCP